MATLKQKNLAREIVENAKTGSKKTAKELLVSAGYDETTGIATPGRTIESLGVQQELVQYGFDVDSAKRVVEEIMGDARKKAQDRLKAADMVFKVHGTYAPIRQDIKAEVKQDSGLTPEQIQKIDQIALGEDLAND